MIHFQDSNIELIEFNANLEEINSGSDNSQYIVLTRNEKLPHVMSWIMNKSRVHVIVLSKNPMSNSCDYTVVIQQKFGNNYLSLIKKVI